MIDLSYKPARKHQRITIADNDSEIDEDEITVLCNYQVVLSRDLWLFIFAFLDPKSLSLLWRTCRLFRNYLLSNKVVIERPVVVSEFCRRAATFKKSLLTPLCIKRLDLRNMNLGETVGKHVFGFGQISAQLRGSVQELWIDNVELFDPTGILAFSNLQRLTVQAYAYKGVQVMKLISENGMPNLKALTLLCPPARDGWDAHYPWNEVSRVPISSLISLEELTLDRYHLNIFGYLWYDPADHNQMMASMFPNVTKLTLMGTKDPYVYSLASEHSKPFQDLPRLTEIKISTLAYGDPLEFFSVPGNQIRKFVCDCVDVYSYWDAIKTQISNIGGYDFESLQEVHFFSRLEIRTHVDTYSTLAKVLFHYGSFLLAKTMARLEKLTIQYRLPDTALEMLTSPDLCPRLFYLDLFGCPLTAYRISSFADTKNLKYLNVANPFTVLDDDFADKHFEPLGNLSHLQVFIFRKGINVTGRFLLSSFTMDMRWQALHTLVCVDPDNVEFSIDRDKQEMIGNVDRFQLETKRNCYFEFIYTREFTRDTLDHTVDRLLCC